MILWLERVLGVYSTLKRVLHQEILGMCVWCQCIKEKEINRSVRPVYTISGHLWFWSMVTVSTWK